MKNLIYGLVDPRTKLVRYVGMSSIGMKRPRRHRSASRLKERNRKASWIKSLLAAGLDYEIVVLEEVSTRGALGGAERFWVAYGRVCGWPLTNLTDGGERDFGVSPEARKKISASKLGHTVSLETRQKISAARRGSVLSAETRAKIAAAAKGRRPSRESVAKRVTSRRANNNGAYSVIHTDRDSTGRFKR